MDLYVVGGRTQPNHLYQNQGDGTFVEVAASVGLDVMHWGSGPVFGDVDGDGDLDLFVGAGDGDPVYLFENRLHAAAAPAGVFVDVTADSGISITSENTVSAAFYDYDGDGHLDLFLSHWGAERRRGEDTETVWRSNGDFTFTSASIDTGVAAAMVAIWSAHLSPGDGVTMDISPASLGNIDDYPQQFADYSDFYNTLEGGDSGTGHDVNPVTGAPYAPQVVPRGDYSRVLAEFWADGPDSETPPGHWFTILNEVNDHELLERRFRGGGTPLGDLEWDVKAYFALGGAMHDAAITAWGIKGWYDYIRPISSLRAMADRGQSSDPDMPSYDVDGIPLEEGYIELVETGDTLAGDDGEHVDKIKLLAWRGPDHIDDPKTDEAGVDWILAENWWPYQRPTFVTPPFAGYISGHSTYSRAAAEVLSALTGDPFFPGGMSGFEIRANEFLVFEEGPSVDMTLQWATYRDASDQTSLSRIWGGIHPPADDIPGRLIGIGIGTDAFALAETYFDGSAP